MAPILVQGLMLFLKTAYSENNPIDNSDKSPYRQIR